MKKKMFVCGNTYNLDIEPKLKIYLGKADFKIA